MVYTYEGTTDNSSMSIILSVPIRKASARKSICESLLLLDVKQKTAVRRLGDDK